MRGVNKVSLLGCVGRDPESRQTRNGGTVVNASIAINSVFGSGDKKQESTEWVNLVFFGKLADVVSKYVKKGSKVYVEGRLETQKWQTETGEVRYSTKVICHELLMLDSKENRVSQSSSSNHGGNDYDDYKGGETSYNNDNLEYIPF